ncbi:sarcosine oxidase subunit gamma [Lacimonas salitolerans]|uniref:Sarcosine oxidase subunit gamma n=1 Tax=Lacimonas salitolerans TaxID=1323750 RepID=A0ABW4EEL6_9RHOB
MAELLATTPCAGLLPITVGSVTAEEAAAGPMTALAPFKGQTGGLADALQAAHGLGWPAPGQRMVQGAARIMWFGHSHALLTGAAPDPALAAHAALTDQSDAWAVVRLHGAGARDVLARLTPLDLRDAVFPAGTCARSDLAHMQGAVLRTGDQAWQVMVFRSMAATLVHDLEIAMRAVAARG